ncbi:TetR/AcrR family transcriptional regulator [Dyella sp. C9]|uniref:TetR/AcrR family transcriptional regulator n=1 Tax=Dyella sp. C9 TaxID=2202154 RepID=UPI001300238E|nr:TetR/AcrR family transcriptional regulator [Dyella sp. C9]
MKTTPYHHGALREALLSAAETILRRDGLQALTLRATAREAGVSHAAPAYHFGDLTGLLTELAVSGMQRLTAEMRDIKASPDRRVWDAARAYVRFARANPAIFQLMFQSDRLDVTRPSFEEARRGAFLQLARTRGIDSPHPSLDDLGHITGGWSLAHGFAMLLLNGRVSILLAAAPPGTTVDDLFEAMLASAEKGLLHPPEPA